MSSHKEKEGAPLAGKSPARLSSHSRTSSSAALGSTSSPLLGPGLPPLPWPGGGNPVAELSRAIREQSEASDALRGECERKAATLAFALQEKAEENLDMWHRLDVAEKRAAELERDRDRARGERDAAVRELEAVRADDKAVIEEVNRRARTISEAMAELAQDNVRLAALQGQKYPAADDPIAAMERNKAERELRDKELAGVKARVGELESAVSAATRQNSELLGKLRAEEQTRQAYVESNNMYEQKVRELEEKMQDSLAKEAQRRQVAEGAAKRLRQRVKELEFLVKELQEADDDDDDDDDDDSDDGKKE